MSDERTYAQQLSKLLTNDGFALASEFGVELHELLPPEYVFLITYLMFVTGSIEKKHFKDITRRWLYGEAPMLTILSDPRYAKADDSVVDTAVEEVYHEHHSKYDGTDKVLNWLVGQVMKKTQGRAQASSVREKLLERLNS